MAEKTEKPTHKKLEDGSKKGQILKSRDAVVTAILIAGVVYISFFFSLGDITDDLADLFVRKFQVNTLSYVTSILSHASTKIISLLFLIIFVVCLSSWVQSKFKIASEAIKINFDAINPVNGFKKMFSLRTVKELVKALIYMVLFSLSVMLFWNHHRQLLFVTVDQNIEYLFPIWGRLFFKLVMYCLSGMMFIIVLDLLAEHFLFMKDMKMDKEEVKREYKEMEGDPMVKSRRREIHQEILSEQLESDIDNSRLIIANPTHVAIGIYFRPDISPIPIISVRESNNVALAVRRYAEQHKIPVIRDVVLARKLYHTHKRYDFVSLQDIEKILALLFWLEDVEKTNQPVEEIEEVSTDEQAEKILENKNSETKNSSGSNDE